MPNAKAGFNSIDEYIASCPKDVQKILKEVRATIRAATPEAEEKISYQMPTFFLNGNLVHFAAFKNHIRFYPIPSGIEKFKKELSVYRGAKGSVQFLLDQPIYATSTPVRRANTLCASAVGRINKVCRMALKPKITATELKKVLTRGATLLSIHGPAPTSSAIPNTTITETINSNQA